MSELYVNKILSHTDANNQIQVASGNVLYAPGHVIQVVQEVTDTEVQVAIAATWTSLMTATITPKSSSSKIMIMCNAASLQKNSETIGYKVTRASTDLIVQSFYCDATDHWSGLPVCINYLDSPATSSAITYTWLGYNHTNGQPLFWNYDNNTLESTNANITLMEIAQ
jgi:hypothetical protein